MMLHSGAQMGRETLKIVASIVGSGAAALAAMLLMQLIPFGGNTAAARFFQFQVSAMVAMALFAGVAIVIYARLSRAPAKRPGQRRAGRISLRK